MDRLHKLVHCFRPEQTSYNFENALTPLICYTFRNLASFDVVPLWVTMWEKSSHRRALWTLLCKKLYSVPLIQRAFCPRWDTHWMCWHACGCGHARYMSQWHCAKYCLSLSLTTASKWGLPKPNETMWRILTLLHEINYILFFFYACVLLTLPKVGRYCELPTLASSGKKHIPEQVFLW